MLNRRIIAVVLTLIAAGFTAYALATGAVWPSRVAMLLTIAGVLIYDIWVAWDWIADRRRHHQTPEQDAALAARLATGNGPPPRVTHGFGLGTNILLFAIFGAATLSGFILGDWFIFVVALLVGFYLLWSHVDVPQGKYRLVLVNEDLTGEVLEHGGHIVPRGFETSEEYDAEESNVDVSFKGICANDVEAEGEFSVPRRLSYDITDKEGKYRGAKIKKVEREERLKAFVQIFALWLLSGLTTEQFVRHRTGFERAVSRALRYGNFPSELTVQIYQLGVARMAEWPLAIVKYFDAEFGSVFRLLALPGGQTQAQTETEARESYGSVELRNGEEIRDGVTLTKATYDKTLQAAQVQKAAAAAVVAQFNAVADAILAKDPNVKDLVGATLAAISKGTYINYAGLTGVSNVQLVQGPIK